jgi:hypothetical protein
MRADVTEHFADVHELRALGHMNSALLNRLLLLPAFVQRAISAHGLADAHGTPRTAGGKPSAIADEVRGVLEAASKRPEKAAA